MSLLIWDTSLKYVLFIFDKFAEVLQHYKTKLETLEFRTPKLIMYLICELKQKAYLEYPCLESTGLVSIEYVSSPRGTLDCLKIGSVFA